MMNVVFQAFMETSMSKAMRDSRSLTLIERICAVFEASRQDDPELAAEVMRIIRAIATGGQVTILSDGPAARLLSFPMAKDSFFWSIVSVADDSVPESAP
jgi:hypothetical protein